MTHPVSLRAIAAAAALFGGLTVAQAQETIFYSTQLRPIEEATKVREVLLKGLPGKVTYVVDEPPAFAVRMKAETQAGKRTASVVGALHGELQPHVPADLQPIDDVEEIPVAGWRRSRIVGNGGNDAFLEVPNLARSLSILLRLVVGEMEEVRAHEPARRVAELRAALVVKVRNLSQPAKVHGGSEWRHDQPTAETRSQLDRRFRERRDEGR